MTTKDWIIAILGVMLVEFLVLGLVTGLLVSNAKQQVANKYELRISNAQVEAAKTTNQIALDHIKQTKELRTQLETITADRNNLAEWVSKRPSRNDPTPPNQCSITGAELSREDGEFLAWEAARAERIMKERDDYYNKYESARKRLASPKASDEGLNGKEAH